MKQAIFVRHAKSSWENLELRDFDRPLNKRGLRDAPFMAKLLQGKAIKIDAIYSSPANRAISTARFFAEALGIESDAIKQQPSIYHAYPEDVIQVIRNANPTEQTILIFGHNPAFTELANWFSPQYIDNIPTCGIFEVIAPIEQWSDFDRSTGRMVAFHYPKQYFTK